MGTTTCTAVVRNGAQVIYLAVKLLPPAPTVRSFETRHGCCPWCWLNGVMCCVASCWLAVVLLCHLFSFFSLSCNSVCICLFQYYFLLFVCFPFLFIHFFFFFVSPFLLLKILACWLLLVFGYYPGAHCAWLHGQITVLYFAVCTSVSCSVS